jgi:hypothetical protein
MSRSWPGIVILGCAACSRAPDPRACVVRLEGTDSLRAAVRCAEAFIVQNGYTDVPVHDSTLVASETVEDAASLADLLVHRRSTLEPRAFAVCHGRIVRQPEPGYTVIFQVRRNPIVDTVAARLHLHPDSLYRGVTLDTLFGSLLMEHMPVFIGHQQLDRLCTVLTKPAA